MVTIQGRGVLKGARKVNRAADKERLHTEGKLVDEQSTRKKPFRRELGHPFGSINHSIIALAHFISIRHGEDQLSLESEHLSSDSGSRRESERNPY
jgi:hypothetical protein